MAIVNAQRTHVRVIRQCMDLMARVVGSQTASCQGVTIGIQRRMVIVCDSARDESLRGHVCGSSVVRYLGVRWWQWWLDDISSVYTENRGKQ